MAINPFGYSPTVWNQAKNEAKGAMASCAAAEDTVSYSELARRIAAIPLEPRDPRLDQLLCEISTEEHQAGRGMLSVVVVHKRGDKEPGPGFFELAESLGENVRDRTGFWIRELQKVYSVWKRPKRE